MVAKQLSFAVDAFDCHEILITMVMMTVEESIYAATQTN